MTITINGEKFTVKDAPSMRFVKAMADARPDPVKDDGPGMALYALRFVASFLCLNPDSLMDADPGEIMAAFNALAEVQAKTPFVASPASAGAQAPASPQDSTSSPTP